MRPRRYLGMRQSAKIAGRFVCLAKTACLSAPLLQRQVQGNNPCRSLREPPNLRQLAYDPLIAGRGCLGAAQACRVADTLASVSGRAKMPFREGNRFKLPLEVAGNLLDQKFTISELNQSCAGNCTYLDIN